MLLFSFDNTGRADFICTCQMGSPVSSVGMYVQVDWLTNGSAYFRLENSYFHYLIQIHNYTVRAIDFLHSIFFL